MNNSKGYFGYQQAGREPVTVKLKVRDTAYEYIRKFGIERMGMDPDEVDSQIAVFNNKNRNEIVLTGPIIGNTQKREYYLFVPSADGRSVLRKMLNSEPIMKD